MTTQETLKLATAFKNIHAGLKSVNTVLDWLGTAGQEDDEELAAKEDTSPVQAELPLEAPKKKKAKAAAPAPEVEEEGGGALEEEEELEFGGEEDDEEPAAPAPALTKNDCLEMLKKVAVAKGKATAMEIMKTTTGKVSVHDVDPKNYGKLYAGLSKSLKGTKKK